VVALETAECVFWAMDIRDGLLSTTSANSTNLSCGVGNWMSQNSLSTNCRNRPILSVSIVPIRGKYNSLIFVRCRWMIIRAITGSWCWSSVGPRWPQTLRSQNICCCYNIQDDYKWCVPLYKFIRKNKIATRK